MTKRPSKTAPRTLDPIELAAARGGDGTTTTTTTTTTTGSTGQASGKRQYEPMR